jgi:hypothetical protein
VEQALIDLLEGYLDSRAARFPGNSGRWRAGRLAGHWQLSVGSDVERITRSRHRPPRKHPAHDAKRANRLQITLARLSSAFSRLTRRSSADSSLVTPGR